MKIIYDDIIYSLQKSGGGSVYWTEIIKPTMNKALHYVYDNAENNMFYKQLNLKNKKKISSNFLMIKRLINPKFGIKDSFIFHSSYFRYCRDKKAINITTVHDFTVEKYRHGIHAIVHKLQQRFAVKHSQGVICVSENTRKDFNEFYPWYKGKIQVIPNGYDDNTYYFEPETRKSKEVIFVGTRADYKRFDIAVQIVAGLLDCHLVIVGGGKLSKKEKQLLDTLLPDKYEKKGLVDNDELRHLYNRAFFLCYPSEYEGFGIPLLEAQACGCPVVCQKKSSIPEVVEDTAIYFDSNKIQSAIQAIKQLYEKKKYLDYQKRGLDNVKRFSWSKSAMKHQKFYKDMWNSFADFSA